MSVDTGMSTLLDEKPIILSGSRHARAKGTSRSSSSSSQGIAREILLDFRYYTFSSTRMSANQTLGGTAMELLCPAPQDQALLPHQVLSRGWPSRAIKNIYHAILKAVSSSRIFAEEIGLVILQYTCFQIHLCLVETPHKFALQNAMDATETANA